MDCEPSDHWRFAAQALDGKYIIMIPENMTVEAGAKAIWVIQPEELEVVEKKGYDWREVRSILDPSGKELMKILEVTGR